MSSPSIKDLIKVFQREFPLTAQVECGTLQALAITTIVNSYDDYGKKWTGFMPYVPKGLRKEINKRLIYKGQLDNDLFSLCVDAETDRSAWNLRHTRENFNDQSSRILSRVGAVEVLHLSHISCSPGAMTSMIEKFPTLRLLEISSTKALDDSVIETLVAHCPSLEVLNVKGSSITDKGLLSLGSASLKLTELDISDTNVSHAGIQHLSNNGVMKESLNLLRFNRCPLLGECKVILQILQSFPNLKDFSFNFTPGNDEGVGWVLDQLPEPSSGQRHSNVSFNIPM